MVPAQEQRVALHHVAAAASRGPLGGFFIGAFGAPPDFSQPYADFAPSGAFTLGVKGAKIKGIDIDYTADGQPSTLHVDWVLTFCGTDERVREDCSS